MSPEEDHIALHGLGLTARVGVPDAERATPQRLAADITLWPELNFDGLGDDISRTIDYAAVALHCRALTASGEWKLIETLAGEIVSSLLQTFPLKAVHITLRKFILPDTDAVSVTLTRSRIALSPGISNP